VEFGTEPQYAGENMEVQDSGRTVGIYRLYLGFQHGYKIGFWWRVAIYDTGEMWTRRGRRRAGTVLKGQGLCSLRLGYFCLQLSCSIVWMVM
jgi:hypothetical protein